MDKSNFRTTGKSGDTKSTYQASTLLKGAGVRQRTDIKMVQNVLVIWLDTYINIKNEDYSNTVIQLRRVVNDINTFTDGDDCIQFIDTIKDSKICMIISGSLGRHIVPRVHNMSQVDSIFILCANKKYHELWIKEWFKIKGVFTEIKAICEALKQASEQCEQNAISMSFVPTSGDVSSTNMDRLDPMFMYSQIMKEILLTITFEQQHFKEFINYCRRIFDDNEVQLEHVNEFKRSYRNETPIWWYTCPIFLFPMLNCALRMIDVDIIIRMGCFIGDLHRQIEQLHKEQSIGYTAGKMLTVYRGQGLSKADFQKMKETKGGLMSFNNFLSTSTDRAVSLTFAESNASNPDLVGILFVMTIDPSKSTAPFASINGISYFPGEDEVLFSMQSVFRIDDIKFMDENQCLIQVDLTLTNENDDKDLRVLTDHIREEISPGCEGWYRLGFVLYKMGQVHKSQQVYEVLLEQATDEIDKAPIYNQLGLMKSEQGEYKEAIIFYEKSVEIKKQTLPSYHPSLASSYNNIGSAYYNIGEYSKALWSFEKTLEIQQQSLSSNHPDFAMSYNNIGAVYYSMGEYSKALSYYEEALEIQQQSLASNHPDLASSYNNIGVVFDDMGEYSKALSFYEKALEIRQQALASNHPSLAASYNNIGTVYYSMGEFSKALSYYEIVLEIQQQSCPSNHADLASSYNNIGNVYDKMGDYSKALSSFEKALEIKQQSLPSNHPDLANSYNNIGIVYYSMGEYSKALSYYEKALEIKQQLFPANHPDLAGSYNNIGAVYYSVGEYSKALLYYEEALEIQKQSLASNHPDLASSYNNIGNVYQNVGKYSKALSSFEKALEIKQKSLPSNHPHLPNSYNNIGIVYYNMGEYSKALSSFKIALEIKQQSFPANHPDLTGSYNNIGAVYQSMGEYSKALSFFEEALEIQQQSLPSNHPHLSASYNSIGVLYEKMGEHSKARSLYERAVNIGQQSLPSN